MGAQGPREGLSPTWVAYTTPSSVPGDTEQPLPRTFLLGEGLLCLDSCQAQQRWPPSPGGLGPQSGLCPHLAQVCVSAMHRGAGQG